MPNAGIYNVYMRSQRIKKSPATKHGFSSVRELLHPKTTLDWVLIVFGGIAIVFAVWIGYDQTMAPLAVHDNAAKFASLLRDAQTYARDNGVPVNVDVHPARPSRPSYFTVSSRQRAIRRDFFTHGVTAVGRILLDEQGVPTARTKITFRKGFVRRDVVMEPDGLVFIPD
jgi:hypothetical protein